MSWLIGCDRQEQKQAYSGDRLARSLACRPTASCPRRDERLRFHVGYRNRPTGQPGQRLPTFRPGPLDLPSRSSRPSRLSFPGDSLTGRISAAAGSEGAADAARLARAAGDAETSRRVVALEPSLTTKER